MYPQKVAKKIPLMGGIPIFFMVSHKNVRLHRLGELLLHRGEPRALDGEDPRGEARHKGRLRRRLGRGGDFLGIPLGGWDLGQKNGS